MNEHIVVPALLGTVLAGTFRQQMLTAWEQLRSRRHGIYLSGFVILVPGLYYAPIDRITAWWVLVAIMFVAMIIWIVEVTWEKILAKASEWGQYWLIIFGIAVLSAVLYGAIGRNQEAFISGTMYLGIPFIFLGTWDYFCNRSDEIELRKEEET